MSRQMSDGVTPSSSHFGNRFQNKNAFGNSGMGKRQFLRMTYETLIVDDIKVEGSRTPAHRPSAPCPSFDGMKFLQQS